MEKVYIVVENCRTKHSDETTCIIGVFKKKEDAEKLIADAKKDINEDWRDIIDDDSWESDEDSTTHYELHRDDYEYIYDVWVEKHTVK